MRAHHLNLFVFYYIADCNCATGATCDQTTGTCQCPSGTTGEPHAGGSGCVKPPECTSTSCTGNNVQCKTDGTKPVCTCTNGGKFPNGKRDVDAPSSESCVEGKLKF